MMKKPLAIIDADLEVKQIKEEMDAGAEMFQKAQEFYRKQEKQQWDDLIGVHWNRLKNLMLERGVLPEDYSEEKYSIGFENGVLYVKENSTKEGQDFAAFLSKLF